MTLTGTRTKTKTKTKTKTNTKTKASTRGNGIIFFYVGVNVVIVMPFICFLNISSARETPCGISKSLLARVYFLREYLMEGLVKIL